jgi:hypothetical protein
MILRQWRNEWAHSLETLGSGTYCKVYADSLAVQPEWPTTGRTAWKVFDRPAVFDLPMVLRETLVYANGHGPALRCLLVNTSAENTGMELVGLGLQRGLQTLWKASEIYTGPEPLKMVQLLWFAEAAYDLAGLHARGLVHADIKPDNILIMPEGNARVSDYGLVTKCSTHVAMTYMEPLAYSLWYRAPELMRAELSNEPWPIGPATDVWALAASMVHVFTGHALTRSKTPYAAYEDLVSELSNSETALEASRYMLPSHGPLISILRRMLDLRPDCRPSMTEVCEGLLTCAGATRVRLTELRALRSIDVPNSSDTERPPVCSPSKLDRMIRQHSDSGSEKDLQVPDHTADEGLQPAPSRVEMASGIRLVGPQALAYLRGPELAGPDLPSASSTLPMDLVRPLARNVCSIVALPLEHVGPMAEDLYHVLWTRMHSKATQVQCAVLSIALVMALWRHHTKMHVKMFSKLANLRPADMVGLLAEALVWALERHEWARPWLRNA